MVESEDDMIVSPVPSGGVHVPPVRSADVHVPPVPNSVSNQSSSTITVFQDLNLAHVYITKMNPAEAEAIMEDSCWELVRSKVHKDILDDAIIVVCAGKCCKRGSEAGLQLRGKILGLIQLNKVIRNPTEVNSWCRQHSIRFSHATRKILVIKTKCWFNDPVKYSTFSNNGNIVPFGRARLPQTNILQMTEAYSEVCE